MTLVIVIVFQEQLNNTIDRYHCIAASSTRLPATITKWTFIRLFVIITRLLVIITRLLCIVTHYMCWGPGTDWLTVSVSQSRSPRRQTQPWPAALAALRLRRLRGFTKRITPTPRQLQHAHTAAALTPCQPCVCLVPLTPLLSEYQSPALFASITIYSVIFTSCPTKSLRILNLLLIRKDFFYC